MATYLACQAGSGVRAATASITMEAVLPVPSVLVGTTLRQRVPTVATPRTSIAANPSSSASSATLVEEGEEGRATIHVTPFVTAVPSCGGVTSPTVGPSLGPGSATLVTSLVVLAIRDEATTVEVLYAPS